LSSPNSKTSTTLMSYAASEIQSQQITSHQQETLLKTHQQLDIYWEKEFNKLISILMEQEEVMIRSWPEELSPTLESSIN